MPRVDYIPSVFERWNHQNFIAHSEEFFPRRSVPVTRLVIYLVFFLVIKILKK